jgi:hypothetical protein
MIGYYYTGAHYWSYGQDANSSYSTGWNYNLFNADTYGQDKMVTFVDNVSYSWHNTVRTTGKAVTTWAANGTSRKGYCKSYDGSGNLWAACFVGAQ